MWHEEKIINGVLCFRANPDGDWEEFTKEALTRELVAARYRVQELEATR